MFDVFVRFFLAVPAAAAPNPERTTSDWAQTLSSAVVPLLPALSLGALLGFAAGYAVKVMGKVVLLIVGVLFVTLQLLSYFELVSINWLRLEALSGPWLQNSGQSAWRWASGVLTHDLPFGGAFVAGLLLGLRRR